MWWDNPAPVRKPFYKRFKFKDFLHSFDKLVRCKIGEGHIQVVGLPPEEKSFHIEMDAPDLQGLYEHLRAAGIEPDGPPTKRSFGRTNFRVHDPDGNIIEFDSNEV